MQPTPDPTRAYETFLPLNVSWEHGTTYAWWSHLRRLRATVAPVVRDLQQSGVISWYGFLVHDYHSGVPTEPDDPKAYVHLRVTLSPEATLEDLQKHLPSAWQWTRPMEFPDPPYLDRVDVSTLRDGDVLLGWKLLGDFSEWALNFVEAHDTEHDIPFHNAAQLIHYLDNMLMLEPMRAHHPAPGRKVKGKGGKGKRQSRDKRRGKKK